VSSRRRRGEFLLPLPGPVGSEVGDGGGVEGDGGVAVVGFRGVEFGSPAILDDLPADGECFGVERSTSSQCTPHASPRRSPVNTIR